MRSSSWISLCGVLAAVCVVQATHTYYSALRCECNGRSRYCLRDGLGLHCVDCQGHTAGRHCERCQAGFYQQGAAAQSCTPCHCHATGSVGAACDSRGRCRCRDGVKGDKCDRCLGGGAIGPSGCTQSRQTREDSGSQACFCYGHSSSCSAQSGFSVHNISSTFSDGLDGWTVATAQGDVPRDVHFRWTPTHRDVEVISKNSLPVYLYAPARYLGNQLLSYGQNFSFSLRLDRGVRHPSTSDVVLVGGGLQVSASLGDLRSIVPCGQKIHYSFRLDEQPGSRWRPQVSALQFQTLLQDVSSVRIRATFGENGRGYLDNVRLVSARRGDGVPAPWVHTCNCPTGYEGEFCERCSAGFRRRAPADGAFGACERCSCRGGGSCDPQTGDCYSADEVRGDNVCSRGFYLDPWRTAGSPQACVKCPCPEGVSCSVASGSLAPQCHRCPAGTSGPRCDVCQEGFYGFAAGGCRPCQCNGHIDVGVAGSCDRISGDCLKCVNNTKGRSCEVCVRGFYHARAADACKPCDCDLLGSESGQCDAGGRCRCRPGFEGRRCQPSDCPSCFSPVKAQVELYAARLKELEARLSRGDGGLIPVDRGAMEAALRAAGQLVDDLQDDSEELADVEKRLQGRLSSISRSQLLEGQNLQNISDQADDVTRRHKKYRTTVEEAESLMAAMRRKLEEAKSELRSAEFPLGDAPLGSDLWTSLVRAASGLADRHQTKAAGVEQSASAALRDSETSRAQVRTLMNKENRVKELMGDLKATLDQTSARAKALEEHATRLSGEAKDESKVADGMLKNIANMERNIPTSLKGDMDAMVTRLDGLKAEVDENTSVFKALQEGVQRDRAAAENRLAEGKSAQQVFNKLLDRVHVAKADTEAALGRIGSNSNELDDALTALRGFDEQIDGGNALADAAIKRLPGINGTIQRAVRDNGQTLSVLDDVSQDYNSALGSVDVLQGLVGSLEGTFGSLPLGALLSDAPKLNEEAKDLKTKAVDLAGGVEFDLDDARLLEAEAEQAADGAAAALGNAERTRDAVGRTLDDIGRLLDNMNKPGTVDESLLKQLEASLADTQRNVDRDLRPRLQDMEQQEDAMRRRLTALDLDLDTVLGDIANLEEVLRSVPEGCYNSPPIEEP